LILYTPQEERGTADLAILLSTVLMQTKWTESSHDAWRAVTNPHAFQEGRDTADLGVLLLSFLMRFGGSFDYDAHAVSVGQGGVIPRAALHAPIPAGHIVQLIVEDIDTKRHVPVLTVSWFSLPQLCHRQVLSLCICMTPSFQEI
jgi:hypothetical protein